MKKDIFISLSGGLDSACLLNKVYQEKKYNNIYLVFFNYNQRHLDKEFNSARIIANHYKINLDVVDINFNFLTNSSLVNKVINVEEGAIDKLPNSFVPARNILFLSYLSSYAYEKTSGEIIISLANHYDDFNGYPDCRLNTIKSLQKTLGLALDRKVKINAPFSLLTKKQLFELYGTEFIAKHSWSCYEGLEKPCNICKSCLLRNEAIND